SDAFGAGAFRSSSPLSVLGPSVRCPGHCASSMVAPAASAIKAADIMEMLLLYFISFLLFLSRIPYGCWCASHHTTPNGEPATRELKLGQFRPVEAPTWAPVEFVPGQTLGGPFRNNSLRLLHSKLLCLRRCYRLLHWPGELRNPGVRYAVSPIHRIRRATFTAAAEDRIHVLPHNRAVLIHLEQPS